MTVCQCCVLPHRSVIGALNASQAFFGIGRSNHVAHQVLWRIGMHVHDITFVKMTEKHLTKFRDTLDELLGRDGSILRGGRSDDEVRSRNAAAFFTAIQHIGCASLCAVLLQRIERGSGFVMTNCPGAREHRARQ